MASQTAYLQSGALTVLFSGEMDSLANNSLRLATADYNNASGYLRCQVEYRGASAQSYTANTGISIWFLAGVVSGTYEDGNSGFTPARGPDVVLPLVSGAIRTTRDVRLPPGAIRPLIKNDGTGVTLASSGNIVRLLPYTIQQTP